MYLCRSAAHESQRRTLDVFLYRFPTYFGGQGLLLNLKPASANLADSWDLLGSAPSTLGLQIHTVMFSFHVHTRDLNSGFAFTAINTQWAISPAPKSVSKTKITFKIKTACKFKIKDLCLSVENHWLNFVPACLALILSYNNDEYAQTLSDSLPIIYIDLVNQE